MLTQMATTHPNQSYPVNEYAASYFMDGNIQNCSDTSSYNYMYYTYDGLGRLKSDLNSYAPTDYFYDAYGNISRKEVQIAGPDYAYTTYTYNANNQLMKSSTEDMNLVYDRNYSQTNVFYTYDANGNLTSETPQLLSKSSGTESVSIDLLGELSTYDFQVKQYTYDGFGQRTGAIVNDKTATYTYNPEGLRVSKTVNGETTTHILDGSNVVADVTNGSVSKYNRGRGLISMEQNGDKGYYVFNGHGDVSRLVGSDSSEKFQRTFNAFGETVLSGSEDLLDNPFGYAGEYTDEETGNIYLRARYYDPAIGRFTSEDPARDGNNWYSYAGNNPVMFFDPSGLAAGDVFDDIYYAAMDWAAEYGQYTQDFRYEIFGLIYSFTDENGETKYSYTKPYFGYEGNATDKLENQTIPDELWRKKDFKIESDIHTHLTNSDFSDRVNNDGSRAGDIPSMEANDRPGFVVNKNGTIRYYRKVEGVTADNKIVQEWRKTVITDRPERGPKAPGRNSATSSKVAFRTISREKREAVWAYLQEEYYKNNPNITRDWPENGSAEGYSPILDDTVFSEMFTKIGR